MIDVELKYNPYSNETHILVSGKMLPESEVKEYVGAEQEISAWAQNFWERIATKCNDDFTVHFCGLMSDYEVMDKSFRAFRQESSDDVSLKPEHIVNPDLIHDEQYVKDELDIVFGKKGVERPELKACPDCKAQIPGGSTYCPACGKKQDGTERVDESRQYVEQYLAGTEAGEETKERFRALYELLQPLYVEKEAVQEEESTQQTTYLHAFSYIREGERFVPYKLVDTSLTQIVIPDDITEIRENTFRDCHRLESVVIPSSVTKIGAHAFRDCSSLKSVVIPDSVTEIGEHAFRDCSSLESVVIPDSVTEIGTCAFFGCCNLTSVVIPDSVRRIESSTFSKCSSLTSVEIPDSVRSIDAYAFNGCDKLKSVEIPPSVHYGSCLGASFPASCKIIKRKQ